MTQDNFQGYRSAPATAPVKSAATAPVKTAPAPVKTAPTPTASGVRTVTATVVDTPATNEQRRAIATAIGAVTGGATKTPPKRKDPKAAAIGGGGVFGNVKNPRDKNGDGVVDWRDKIRPMEWCSSVFQAVGSSGTLAIATLGLGGFVGAMNLFYWFKSYGESGGSNPEIVPLVWAVFCVAQGYHPWMHCTRAQRFKTAMIASREVGLYPDVDTRKDPHGEERMLAYAQNFSRVINMMGFITVGMCAFEIVVVGSGMKILEDGNLIDLAFFPLSVAWLPVTLICWGFLHDQRQSDSERMASRAAENQDLSAKVRRH
jgi:hypothetical protein